MKYWYNDQGLGDSFRDSLFSDNVSIRKLGIPDENDIDSLQLYGSIHAQHFGYYRLLSKRFPFAIYYRVARKTVCIQAVLDCRRNPVRIEERLK
ncbi:MAG: hypothetical protein C0407_15650 [Desulfobacca sp.]|nr:hypothetical protein [Desulfobacca sp.]